MTTTPDQGRVRARAAAAVRAGVERGDPLEPQRLADVALAPADDEQHELEPAAPRHHAA